MANLSTKEQRKTIGYMRKLLGLDEDTYREMLSSYGVVSSKKLTHSDAKQLVNKLRDNAKEAGVFKPVKSYAFQKYKYNNHESRKGMATPLQLRKIEAMWFKVSNANDDAEREKALNKFCERITGKCRLMFVTQKDISKLIKALETMIQNMEGESKCKMQVQ